MGKEFAERCDQQRVSQRGDIWGKKKETKSVYNEKTMHESQVKIIFTYLFIPFSPFLKNPHIISF